MAVRPFLYRKYLQALFFYKACKTFYKACKSFYKGCKKLSGYGISGMEGMDDSAEPMVRERGRNAVKGLPGFAVKCRQQDFESGGQALPSFFVSSRKL